MICTSQQVDQDDFTVLLLFVALATFMMVMNQSKKEVDCERGLREGTTWIRFRTCFSHEILLHGGVRRDGVFVLSTSTTVTVVLVEKKMSIFKINTAL